MASFVSATRDSTTRCSGLSQNGQSTAERYPWCPGTGATPYSAWWGGILPHVADDASPSATFRRTHRYRPRTAASPSGGPAGAGLVQEARVGERPVRDLGLPDDVVLGQEPDPSLPLVRVAGAGPVVAQHEQLALRHHRPGLALAAVVVEDRPVDRVRLAVDDRGAVLGAHLDLVAGQPDHALDERDVAAAALAALARGGGGRVEDDDVAALDVAEVVDEPVGDDAVARLDGGRHRRASGSRTAWRPRPG